MRCETESLKVPVCTSCADRHRAEWKPTAFLDRIIPALKSEKTIAFIFPFLTFLFFFSIVLEDVKKLNFERAAWMMLPVGFFAVIAGILWSQIANQSHQYGIPTDTIVSGSVTFSYRKKRLLEPERRRFEFRNPAFADAFIEANRARLWDARSPKAINAAHWRTMLQYGAYGVFGLAMLWGVISEFME